MQMVGLVGDHDKTVVRSDVNRPTRLVVGYFLRDRLVAAECVNSPADFVVLRTALNRGMQITPNMFSDSTVPLKKTLARVDA